MESRFRQEVGLLPCLVIGDSIAVGVGQQLPECRTEARKGITSHQFMAETRPDKRADRIVISLGANDDAAARTLDNLTELRRSVQASVVYWLIPAASQRVRAAVRTVAGRYGDRIIDTAPFAGQDGLHPTGSGYRKLAMMTR
jgi:lysophospholipase L1-like esterase